MALTRRLRGVTLTMTHDRTTQAEDAQTRTRRLALAHALASTLGLRLTAMLGADGTAPHSADPWEAMRRRQTA